MNCSKGSEREIYHGCHASIPRRITVSGYSTYLHPSSRRIVMSKHCYVSVSTVWRQLEAPALIVKPDWMIAASRSMRVNHIRDLY